MAVDFCRNYITLRMHEISHETHHIKAVAVLDGIFILPLDIFALLCLVGLRELPERW